MIGSMAAFSLEHWLMLALTVALAVWVLRRRHRRLRAAGWALLVLAVFWMVWDLMPARFDPQTSLPLHYSDALRLITAYALLTGRRWAMAVSFYWGLTLNLLSIMTPDVTYWQVPWLEFCMYWVLHIACFLAPLAFVANGYRPRWWDWGAAVTAMVAWGLIAMAANAAVGANYGYLNAKPAAATALDWLGPWPLYLVVGLGLLAAVWGLMTVGTVRRQAS